MNEENYLLDYLYNRYIKHRLSKNISADRVKKLLRCNQLTYKYHKNEYIKKKILLKEDYEVLDKAFYFKQLFFSHQDLVATDDFFDEPINPNNLIKAVKIKMDDYSLKHGEKTYQLIKELCKTFNECIKSNKSGKDINYIVSPQTGAAKTLTAKVYVSLLKDESSVIIVPTVADAIEIANDINNWSMDDTYARCHYVISIKNGKKTYYADKDDLHNYRCIVITHAMYNYINKTEKEAEKNKILYKNSPRDLVIIDERIETFDRYIVSYFEVEHTLVYLSELSELHKDSSLKLSTSLQNLIDILLYVQDSIFKIYPEFDIGLVYEDKDGGSIGVINGLKGKLDNIENNLQQLKILLIQNKLFLTEDNKKLNKIQNVFKAIKQVSCNDYLYIKLSNNQYLATVLKIKSYFNSRVTMDATAKLNAIYQTLYQSSIYEEKEDIKLIHTTNPKIYNNLTIHLAEGYPQGKSSIMKENNLIAAAQEYLYLVNNLINDTNDTILVITFKHFREVLESHNTNPKIHFTHWGNHKGKNDWNTSSKVIVIGWNFYNNIDYYINFLGVSEFYLGQNDINSLGSIIKRKFKLTQAVEDLVQAVNRIAVRNSIDKKGNCPSTHIYLFYGNTEEYKETIEMFKLQFPGALIDNSWRPILNKVSNKSKKQRKIDNIVHYISEELSKENRLILERTSVIQEFDIPRSTATRLFSEDYFIKRIEEENIIYFKHDGKSLAFKPL